MTFKPNPRIILSIFLILVNFIFSYQTIDPVNPLKDIIISLFVVLISLYNIFKIKEYRFSISELMSFGTILIIVSLSYFNIQDNLHTKHLLVHFIRLASFFTSFIVLLLLIREIPSMIIRQYLLKLVLFILAVHCFIGLCQFIGIGFRYFPPYELFPNSTLVNRNLYASNLILSLLLILYLNNRSKQNKTIVKIVFAAVFILTIFTTSRVGITAIIIIGLIYLKRYYLRNAREYANVLLASAALYIILLIFLPKHTIYISRKFLHIFQGGAYADFLSGSANERVVLWKATIQMISDNSIWGVGIGQWPFDIWNYDLKNIIAKSQAVAILRPHNELLKLVAEHGIVASVLVVFLFAMLLLKIRKNTDALLFLFALLFFAFFNFPFESHPHKFLFILFIISILLFEQSSENYKVPRFIMIVVQLAFIGCFIIAGLFQMKRFQAEVFHKRGISLQFDYQYEASNFELNKINSAIYFLDPVMNTVDQIKARNYFALQDYEASLKHLDYAINDLPNAPYLKYDIGLTYFGLQQCDGTIYWMTQALNKIPNYCLIYEYLDMCYQIKGAQQQIKIIDELKVRYNCTIEK